MHVHVEESNEKKRLREATAIITVGGVTNGVLGTAKVVPRQLYRVPAIDCFGSPLAVGHCIRSPSLGSPY